MMTQIDLLTRHVMGSGSKVVNVVGVSGVNPDEPLFEVMYNKEVHFLANQIGGFSPNYPMPDGSRGWNMDRDDGLRDWDREWSDSGTDFIEWDSDKERYIPPHERRQP
ncbi:hypothetical protein MTR67_052294 [Solanum verrucosum]|uniref:Uncharacterized protein n=1 Tax=Solanum verrucosum TaxID=315347 RepID=A0AAF1A3E6_SOLVR|nr:hypothetical protein MTR67_052294 [Solanum verrucosum]